MQEAAADTRRRPALHMGPVEWALVVLHSVLWGSAFFFVDLAKAELPATTITALRLIPAVTVLAAIALAAGHSLSPLIGDWRRYLILAAINNYIPFVLIIYGQSQVTGGIAAVFNATTPLFAIVLAHLVTHDEKLRANRLAGIVIGIAGVAVLSGGIVAGASAASLLAPLALLGAAFCYAAAGVFSRGFAGTHPYVVATGQMAYSLMIAVPIMLILDRTWEKPMPSATALAAMGGMGLFGSALASLCYFTVLRRAGATNALLVTLLLPVTPMALGALFLGQSLSLREAAGAALIGLALVIIDGRILNRRHGEAQS